VKPGERIGPYRIERRLGEGGIGEVFQAVDEALARPVAIKRLRPELAAREPLVARFRSEAQTLARLNHPNIATLYALEHAEGSMCMVMEYVEGETISSLLRERGPLDLEPALRLAIQALDGIGYAHACGVIHRDIKGSNLMLDATGTLKLMDFGIARVLGEQRQTRAGALVGTPEFMAPEQVRGEDADERSDLYSLAILFFSLRSGRAPFRAHSEYDVLKAQVEQAAPSILDENPDLPAELDAVLRRALAKRPEDRFQSAAEFRTALEALGELPTPSGAFVWPLNTPRQQAETSLLLDTGADPDAPTRVPGELGAASALPLIDAELLSDAPTTALDLPAPRPGWGRGWQEASWLVAVAFLLVVATGLDVLTLRPVGTSNPRPPVDPLEVRLGPQREPNATARDESGPQALDALYGPNQSRPPGTARELLERHEATRPQAPERISRSRERAPEPATRARPGEPRMQGEKKWVIRRR